MLRGLSFIIEIPAYELHQKYDNKMEGVGIADKPRKYYRIYFGVRERKW